MARLSILPPPSASPGQFMVLNRDTSQTAPPATVPSPYDWPVPGGGEEKLMTQLRWHLEGFLEYPFSPYTEKAIRVEEALKAWGQTAFQALFDNRVAGSWLPADAGAVFDILITCDSPEHLAWPWEALCDPTLGFFAHRARIERRLSHEVPHLSPLPPLPRDRIHILLITSRPYKKDVDYRSVSRPLVDLIREEKLPATVDVLRPPTLDQLRAHLEARPDYYHILHFDGHGGYGTKAPGGTNTMFKGHEGRLLFETEEGEPHEVTATKLTEALVGCTVPLVVLNACRSAQVDAQAAEGRAFASVAGALVKAGLRGVLAMGYNLTVSGARVFLPPFYRQLFKSGRLLEAAREGRRTMFLKPHRSGWNPESTLPDWLLPVVYQQAENFTLDFATQAVPQEESISLPPDAAAQDPLGFVGRDEAIQALERTLRERATATLIHGLGGVGKTTLARHFLQWLRDTGGLVHRPFWFSFDDIRSATHVFNTIGRALFGIEFDGDQPAHLDGLTRVLREQALILVWDNFESARGFQTEHVSGLLSAADQTRLKDFLKGLHGGKTKVLITSRSPETWLPPEHCRRLPLGGLRGEDLWEYAATVLDMLGLKVDKKDLELQKLLTDLGGHPVLIRAVLAQLSTHSARSLQQQWQASLPTFLQQVDDPVHARLLATLDLTGASFSEAERTALIPIALHERFVDLRLVQLMGKSLESPPEPTLLEGVFHRLVRSGLLTELGQNIFIIHPLLTSYLRVQCLPTSPPAQVEAWQREFVDLMGSLADTYAPKQLHEQRTVFYLHHASFHAALRLAEALQQHTPTAALLQALAAFALNTRDYAESATLFQRLAAHHQAATDPGREAGALHQLGIIAEEQRDFSTARDWFLKSLAIKEKHGNELGAAITYHQLGIIAEEQRDFSTARDWYLKSLAIEEKHGNDHGAAITYHQLGSIAQEQRDFSTARDWYLKSLAISEKHGNEHHAASTHGQLGNMARGQGAFVESGQHYLRAFQLFATNNDERLAHQVLGLLANLLTQCDPTSLATLTATGRGALGDELMDALLKAVAKAGA